MEEIDFGYEWVSPKTKLGDTLRPTPYTPQTYWQIPKGPIESYFCYFTSKEYRNESSDYRLLDETLLKYGAYSDRRTVIVVDRYKIPDPLWDAILEKLDINDWPALTVCQTSLGLEEVQLTDSSFQCPKKTEFVKLERGVISDRLLNDPDKLKDFLNSLHEATKDNNLKNTMRKLKSKELLSIGSEKIESMVVFNAPTG
jgi:hypothetical protein